MFSQYPARDLSTRLEYHSRKREPCCTNDGVQLWRVRKKVDNTPERPSVEVSCQWSVSKGRVYLCNLQILGVTRLDSTNLGCLKQRDAIGEPAESRIKEVEGGNRGWAGLSGRSEKSVNYSEGTA